jgi:hypothetical protein
MLSAVSGLYTNTVTRGYDAGGRVASESLTIFGQTYTMAQAYVAGGRLTTLTYPDGSVVTKSYSPRQQLTGLSLNGTSLASFAYWSAPRFLIHVLREFLQPKKGEERLDVDASEASSS